MRIILPIVLIAPLATATPSVADPGEAAYQEACASCHRTPARFMRRYADMLQAERQRALDEFLKVHHAQDAEKRATIIAWLEANHLRR